MADWIIGRLRWYTNRFYKKTYSEEFLRLWTNETWTMNEYLYCHKEMNELHEDQVLKQSLLMIALIIAAGVFFLFDEFLVALGLFVLALRSYSKSRQHLLCSQILHTNLMLARLQNGLNRANSDSQ